MADNDETAYNEHEVVVGDDQGIPYDMAQFMVENQRKIQALVDEIETFIHLFDNIFANGNVSTTRHEHGTLKILHYHNGGHENEIDEWMASDLFRIFEELPDTIQTLQNLVDVYTKHDDYEDFRVGGDKYIVGAVSIYDLFLGDYEDYAHLMAVWRARAELHWITWQEAVQELEYAFIKPRKPFYSSELKELLVEFTKWFKQLELLSDYQFQGVASNETRSIVGWRLRGCMHWKVFKRAEAATGLDKKYHSSSFQDLFGEQFPRRKI